VVIFYGYHFPRHRIFIFCGARNTLNIIIIYVTLFVGGAQDRTIVVWLLFQAEQSVERHAGTDPQWQYIGRDCSV
jgi:hypothetical protein